MGLKKKHSLLMKNVQMTNAIQLKITNLNALLAESSAIQWILGCSF